MTGPSLEEIDPALLAALLDLFDKYGPAGVKQTVEKLIDRQHEIGMQLAVAQRLTNPQPEAVSPDPVEPPRESAGAVLQRMGIDAAKWTDEFLKWNLLVNRDGFAPNHSEAWGNMVGWFANAIEAGRAVGRQEALTYVGPPRDT